MREPSGRLLDFRVQLFMDACFFSTLPRYICWNLFWLWKLFTLFFLSVNSKCWTFQQFNFPLFVRYNTLQLPLFLWVWTNECFHILKADLFRRLFLIAFSFCWLWISNRLCYACFWFKLEIWEQRNLAWLAYI